MRNKTPETSKDAGFSLVETVIALLLFSLTAAILLPTALTSAQRANKDRMAFESDLRLHKALTAELIGIAGSVNEDAATVTSDTQTSPKMQVGLQTISVQQGTETFVIQHMVQVDP